MEEIVSIIFTYIYFAFYYNPVKWVGVFIPILQEKKKSVHKDTKQAV